MIKEIIVVEGKDDTAAIRRAVQAETIETGGSALNAEVLESIRLAQQRRGVIIFTDPDHAGEKIRSRIAEAVPGCKHAFLDRNKAKSKKGAGIGVEHADPEAIRLALKQVKTERADVAPEITREDLLRAGLIVHPDAAARRDVMGRLLHIGYANGKQFYNRCKKFRISREEFFRALEQMEGAQKQQH